MPMKICFFVRAMPAHSKGGLQDHVMTLAEIIVRRGHKVVVITTKHPRSKPFEIIDGVEIYYLDGTVPSSYFKGFWERSVEIFKKLHLNEPFDIVHSHGAGGYGFLKRKVNKKYNIPAVVSLHGTNYDEIKTQLNLLSLEPTNIVIPLLSILQQLYYYFFHGLSLLRLSDGIIATSNEQAEIIKKFYFIREDKIFKAFNGIHVGIFVPLKKFDRVREIYKILSSTNLILSIARLERDKGIQNIIRSLPLILKEFPDTKLMIVGDGSYASKLKKMVKKLKIENNVIFTGMLTFESLPEYFNACDIFVNPTIRQNGYDLTILEAMACEKPVVVSNIGSVPTVINDGADGILVPPGDIKKLAEGVIQVLKDKEMAEHLGKAARRKVVEKFSAESMVEGTLKVYEEVIMRAKKKSFIT